jgi:hypothetical protein
MRTTTREEIIDEVRQSLERHGASAQRYRQLKSALSRCSAPLVGDALLQYWQTLTEPDDQFVEQEFLAGLLLELNPPASVTLRQVLGSLRNWNLSVQEFPWYLALQFGENQVLEALHDLQSESPDDQVLLRAAETVRFWLQADYATRRQQYRYRRRGAWSAPGGRPSEGPSSGCPGAHHRK